MNQFVVKLSKNYSYSKMERDGNSKYGEFFKLFFRASRKEKLFFN